MYNSAEIANRIKNKAKAQKVPIKDMLLACDLSKNALSSMLSGGSIPKSENLAKIADYLDCSVDYLLGRTDNPSVWSSGGINQSNVYSDHNMINVNSPVQSKQSDDSLTSEFMSAFNELDFDNKVKAMNYVSKLKNEK